MVSPIKLLTHTNKTPEITQQKSQSLAHAYHQVIHDLIQTRITLTEHKVSISPHFSSSHLFRSCSWWYKGHGHVQPELLSQWVELWVDNNTLNSRCQTNSPNNTNNYKYLTWGKREAERRGRPREEWLICMCVHTFTSTRWKHIVVNRTEGCTEQRAERERERDRER
jgi:hypothetical protein